LRRVDWRRDLHFQTRTTIDTLDYSGSGLNQGSKLVIAAVGAPVRELPASLEGDLRLPDGFSEPKVCLPGVLAIRGPAYDVGTSGSDLAVEKFCDGYRDEDGINRFPLIVIVDESDFTARTLNNFLWVVFTRSNPASDIYGVDAFFKDKHWGARGSLVVDARAKPHHAPPLIEDPATTSFVDALATRSHPLAKWL
jgi:4-hydroxy-3-polyprenylbenzoate decarboxylase